jgi:hypothetical protein
VNKDRDEPTVEQVAEWADDGVAEAVEQRERIEPDDYCARGSPCSLKLAYI